MVQILLLMSPGENRQLLKKLLSSKYTIIIPENKLQLGKLHFDLCIIDHHGLSQQSEFVKERKQSENPVFLPFLCLISGRLKKSLKISPEDLIDEMIVTPINPLELELRIRHLLKLRSQSEKLKAANKAAILANAYKSEFVSNISHEIRTPMNGILGYIRLLMGTPLNDQQKSYGKVIQKSAEALLTLINDILDMSRIEAGKLTIESTDFDLKHIISDVFENLSLQAMNRNLELSATIQDDLDVSLTGDPNRLRQILLNLVGNALKFTENGGVRINVLKENETPMHIDLLFEVVDTGVGVADDAKYALFDSFSQADTSTTRIYGGSGLGLYIVKKLVGLMGGSVGFDSEVGKGSSFWFRLQFLKSDGKGDNLPEKKGIIYKDGIRILVVEDYQVNQHLILENLKSYDVSLSTNGNEAIEILKKENFDIVFMDIQMPEMDGYETTKKIRDPMTGVLNPDVPVVALTAHSLLQERELCLKAGMDDFVGKPFSPGELHTVIQKWVTKKPAQSLSTDDAPHESLPDKDLIFFMEAAQIQYDEALKIMGGKQHILDIVFQTFADDIPEKLTVCRKALQERDFQSLERNVHSVKSAFRSICAHKASDISQDLEQAAREKDQHLVESLFVQFEKHLNRAENGIRKYFNYLEKNR